VARIEKIGRLRRLYQGHFVQHETEKPWVLKARQDLHDRLPHAIRDAARECEHARRWEDAAALYQSGIELDSLNEGMYRGLMLCRQQLGDHSEALLGAQQSTPWPAAGCEGRRPQ
jgi:two-component SAPR family response regulator